MNVAVQLEMETLMCGESGCGIVFAVPRLWKQTRQKDHSTWYCPNGHARYFQEKTQEEIVRENLARERASHDQTKAELQDALRRSNAARAHLSRIKNRAEAGVCIHCNRTFEDLARHMKSKHSKSEKAKA